MSKLTHYLTFRKLISPLILKILFWPALGATIYFSIRLIMEGYAIGWVPLTVGSLFTRVIFEMLLLFFTMNEKLYEINESIKNFNLSQNVRKGNNG